MWRIQEVKIIIPPYFGNDSHIIQLIYILIIKKKKKDEKNAFQIINPQKSFTVYAGTIYACLSMYNFLIRNATNNLWEEKLSLTDTPQDKESWINIIRETKEDYLSAKRTLKIGMSCSFYSHCLCYNFIKY